MKNLSDINTLSRGDVILFRPGFTLVSMEVDTVNNGQVYLTEGQKNLTSSTRQLYTQEEINERVEKAGWVLAIQQ